MTDCTKQHELVCVEWVDAEQQSGWNEFDPKEPLWVMFTYGILVAKTKNWIVLADTHLPPDSWGGLNKIPVGTVKRVTKVLEYARCHRKQTVVKHKNTDLTGSSDEPPVDNLSLDIESSAPLAGASDGEGR